MSQPGLWRRVVGYFRPEPIRSLAELQNFLSGEGAQLAQYATFQFSRNTLGYFGQHAFWHDRFQGHMRICRWESFAAVLADLVVLTEGRLRPAVGAPDLLVEKLAQVYRQVLESHPAPEHRQDGWRPDVAALLLRLQQAQLAQPHGPNQVALVAGRRVFEVLPVYSGNTPADFETISNMIRMGEVRFHEKLERCLDVRAIAAELAG